MLDVAIKILDKITDCGYSAYIVGGFVRDYLLGIETNDIDICTNAKPRDLLEIFDQAKIPKEDYGAVTILYHDIRFEITTFRKEIQYVNHRKPMEIQYIDSLEEDIMRRDFTINTLCMDKEGNIIDFLNGRSDIDAGIIRAVGDSDTKFSQDALRILRAVRFATKLQFQLDDDVVLAIKKNKSLLREISYERKRRELDKIFTSHHNKQGIRLLLDLGLDRDLEIPNLKDVKYTDSLIGIWCVLDVLDVYKFSNHERESIELIRKALQCDNLDPYHLYHLGLYANSVAGEMKGISKDQITKAYNSLAIQSRSDIGVSAMEISEALGKKPDSYLNDIYEDLERNILSHRLSNEKEELLNYCVDNYREVC